MPDYKIVKVLAEGLVVLGAKDFADTMFTRCKARKVGVCVECDGAILSGASVYRPITNGYNRMHRLHELCVIRIAQRQASVAALDKT